MDGRADRSAARHVTQPMSFFAVRRFFTLSSKNTHRAPSFAAVLRPAARMAAGEAHRLTRHFAEVNLAITDLNLFLEKLHSGVSQSGNQAGRESGRQAGTSLVSPFVGQSSGEGRRDGRKWIT